MLWDRLEARDFDGSIRSIIDICFPAQLGLFEKNTWPKNSTLQNKTEKLAYSWDLKRCQPQLNSFTKETFCNQIEQKIAFYPDNKTIKERPHTFKESSYVPSPILDSFFEKHVLTLINQIEIIKTISKGILIVPLWGLCPLDLEELALRVISKLKLKSIKDPSSLKETKEYQCCWTQNYDKATTLEFITNHEEKEFILFLFVFSPRALVSLSSSVTMLAPLFVDTLSFNERTKVYETYWEKEKKSIGNLLVVAILIFFNFFLKRKVYTLYSESKFEYGSSYFFKLFNIIKSCKR
jgi:hypothetical protein